MGGTHRESGDDLLEHQYLCRLRLRIAASCLAQLPHLLAEPRGLVDQLLTLLQQGVQRLRHGRQLVAVRGHRQGRGLRLDLELSKYTHPRPAAHVVLTLVLIAARGAKSRDLPGDAAA
jgi:hypothetical protein